MNIEELIQEFKKGRLTQVQQQELEQQIAAGKVSLEELEDYQLVLDRLDRADQLGPSTAADQGFDALLVREQARLSQNANLWRYARWILLALAAGMAVYLLWPEAAEPPAPEQMPMAQNDLATHLLNTQDVSDKINILASSQETQNLDQANSKVIDVLLFTLNHDASNNVRLACIDVLMNYSHLPEVRKGLVDAISHQSSPIVLSNLAEALAASGSIMKKDEFHKRINPNLPPPVQQTVEDLFTQL